jgi:D-alanine-D-alanine ligase
LSRPVAALLYGRLVPGAAQDEQDVLVEVRTVREALEVLGYRPQEVQLDLDLRKAAVTLQRLSPRLVFNLVESVAGRDRLVHLAPSLLEHLGLPFTGCSTASIFATSNKLLAKRLLQGAGLPTPPWRAASAADPSGPEVPPPWIVKSVWDHASIGLSPGSVTNNEAQLRAELARRGASANLFFESYIDGREFNLSLLEMDGQPVVLPAAEIRFVGYAAGVPRIVDYAAKWSSDSAQYNNTPRSFEFPPTDKALLQSLRDQALRCWRIFELSGYARVDFRIDEAGRPWVLEANANPCLSPDAGFQAAAAQAGLSPTQVVEHIVTACLHRSAASRPPGQDEEGA